MTNDIIRVMEKVDEQIGYDLNEQDIDAVLRQSERCAFLVTWKKSLRKRVINSTLEADLDEFYKKFIKTGPEQSE